MRTTNDEKLGELPGSKTRLELFRSGKVTGAGGEATYRQPDEIRISCRRRVTGCFSSRKVFSIVRLVTIAVVVGTVAAKASLRSTGAAQDRPGEFRSGGDVMVVGDNSMPDKPSDCAIHFAEFVRNLDEILASAPKAIDPIYSIFRKTFPIPKCNVEEVLTVARKSRFFVGSDESPSFYNLAFNSASVGIGNGYAVLISLNKKTGNMEMPFAKVNGF